MSSTFPQKICGKPELMCNAVEGNATVVMLQILAFNFVSSRCISTFFKLNYGATIFLPLSINQEF
jgi:hypothetical protein